MGIDKTILLMINERLYKNGKIDKDTKEKIEKQINKNDCKTGMDRLK